MAQITIISRNPIVYEVTEADQPSYRDCIVDGDTMTEAELAAEIERRYNRHVARVDNLTETITPEEVITELEA